MKLFVIAIACLIQFTALAQRSTQEPASQAPAKDTSGKKSGRIDYMPALDLRYRGGYVLAHPAGLYRSLADAQRGRPAHWLRAGTQVFAVTHYPSGPDLGQLWIRVARDTYLRSTGPEPGVDTTIYYLRTTALYSKTSGPELFMLH